MRAFFFSFLFLITAFANEPSSAAAKQTAEPICYFIPPDGWEIAQLRNASPYVQIGFLGKGSGLFRPSINFAYEEVDVGLKEYVKAVKEIHLSEPNIKCRDLGKFTLKAGEGRLLEITSPHPGGEIKQFQAFIVKGEKAYILTAAMLKEDLPKLQSEVIKSLQSLNLVSDLYAPLSDSGLRKELQSFAAALDLSDGNKKKSLESFDKILSEKCPQLGSYWRYLVLADTINVSANALK